MGKFWAERYVPMDILIFAFYHAVHPPQKHLDEESFRIHYLAHKYEWLNLHISVSVYIYINVVHAPSHVILRPCVRVELTQKGGQRCYDHVYRVIWSIRAWLVKATHNVVRFRLYIDSECKQIEIKTAEVAAPQVAAPQVAAPQLLTGPAMRPPARHHCYVSTATTFFTTCEISHVSPGS